MLLEHTDIKLPGNQFVIPNQEIGSKHIRLVFAPNDFTDTEIFFLYVELGCVKNFWNRLKAAWNFLLTGYSNTLAGMTRQTAIDLNEFLNKKLYDTQEPLILKIK